MSLNIVESYYENKKKYDKYKNILFQRLQEKGIVVSGYHSSKGKLGFNRERYNCIVESITGYSVFDDLDWKTVQKMCKSLVEFRDKYRDELQKETVFDIRKYIFYYSKCPNERYYLSFDEFNHLIHFFTYLSDDKEGFDYTW
jgi:hypothetical protein